MIVKVAGKSTRHGSGFYGAKCTAVKLHFVPVHEVLPYHLFAVLCFIDKNQEGEVCAQH